VSRLLIPSFLFALAAICVEVSVHEYHEAQSLRLALEALKRSASAREIHQAAQQELQRKQTLALKTKNNAGAKGQAEAQRNIKDWRPDLAYTRAFVAKNPILRSLYLKQFAAEINSLWGRLFMKLNLSPDQIQRVTTTLVNFEANKMDLAAVDTAGSPDEISAQQAAFKQETAEYKDSIKSIIGDENYETFHAYGNTLTLQPVVNEMIGSLYSSADSLSDNQVDHITQILAANSAHIGGYVQAGSTNWDVAMPQIRSIVTPAQAESLQPIATEAALKHQMYLFSKTQLTGAAQNPGVP
jgi:hypothetical protein